MRSGPDEIGKRGHKGFLDEAKGTVFVGVVYGDSGSGRGVVPHFRVGLIETGGDWVMRGVPAICRCPLG